MCSAFWEEASRVTRPDLWVNAVTLFSGTPGLNLNQAAHRHKRTIILSVFNDCEKNNYKKLYTVLSGLGVFTFCTCCKILICLVYTVASFKLSCV